MPRGKRAVTKVKDPSGGLGMILGLPKTISQQVGSMDRIEGMLAMKDYGGIDDDTVKKMVRVRFLQHMCESGSELIAERAAENLGKIVGMYVEKTEHSFAGYEPGDGDADRSRERMKQIVSEQVGVMVEEKVVGEIDEGIA
jgi:hypothetical protein